MFQWTLISLFGLFLGLKNINFLCLMFDLNEKQQRNMRIGTLFVLVFVFLLLQKQIFLLFCVCFSLFFTPLVVKWMIFFRQRSYFRQNIVSFLDGITLQMRLGHSFLDSLRLSARTHPTWFVKECEIFAESITLDKKISEKHVHSSFFADLALIAKQKHKQIDKLKCLRRKIKIEEDFRQKSRSALVQIRAQCLFLSAMYLLLLIYQLMQGVHTKLPLLMLGSISLFIVGLLWIIKAGRSYKWKI